MHPRHVVLALVLLALAFTAPVFGQPGIRLGDGGSGSSSVPSTWRDGDTLCDPGGAFAFNGAGWPPQDPTFTTPDTTVACRVQPSDEVPFGGHAPEALDATVCRGEPKARDGERLNVSVLPAAATNDPQCMVVLRFPVKETLPKNATVLSAVLTLYMDPAYYTNNAQRTAALDRNLTVRNVFATWDEETATFDRFPRGTGYNTSASGPLDTNEGFHSAAGANPFAGGGDPSAQGPGQTFSSAPLPKSFRVTPSVACAYAYEPGVERVRNCEGHTHGWIVQDEPNSNCASTEGCLQMFYSSGARTTDNEPLATCSGGGPNGQMVGDSVMGKPYCWPKLDVLLDPNRAVPRNLTFHYNTSSPHRVWDPDIVPRPEEAIFMPGDVPFNISIDGEDAKGRILSGGFEIRNKTGHLFVREDFEHKRFNTSGFDIRRHPGDHSRLWTVRAFDLPEGQYFVNVTLLDNDNHRRGLNMTGGPVLWIDATPPTLSKTTHVDAVPQAEPVNLTTEFFDERRVDAASVEVTQPSGAKLTFKMRPAETFEDGKRSTWYFQRAWSAPGNYTMQIRVNDTLGNANASGPLAFRVIDIGLPEPCGATVTAPDVRFGVYVQEEGAKVHVDACVVDETPLVVFVACAGPDGSAREWDLAPASDGRFAGDLVAEAPGRHACAVRARDRDANVVDVLAFPLLVEAASAPRASSFVPLDGGFTNATPVASVLLSDVNLDLASVRLESSVDGGPFERAVPSLLGTAIETRAFFTGHTFGHGDAVTLRASANDTLGHTGVPVTWSFKVDAKAPRLNVTLVGDRAPGPVAPFVTRQAKVAHVATDDASGVARVEAKWIRLPPEGVTDPAARAETPWREVSGDVPAVDPEVDRGAGVYAVVLRAVDAVGNAAPPEEVRFVLDPDAPVVTVGTGAGELRLDVADPGSGLASLVVGSRLLGDPAFRVVDLAAEIARTPQGGRFVVPTPALGKGQTMEYHVTAVDALGNRRAVGSPTEPARAVGVNHPPTLSVEGPADDSEVQGPLEVRWRATDEDGDSVRVRVDIRPVVLPEGENLASNAPPRGIAAWDSRQAPDGVYLLEVEARDGESATRHATRLVVNNTGTGLGRLEGPSGRVEYLDTVRFEVTLYRPVVDAKVRVFEVDGDERRLVATHVLVDDGTRGDRAPDDGVYTATYEASEKGDYVTDVEVVYGDAGTVTLPSATTYSVRSSFSNVLERNLAWFLLGGALVVALAAAAIVQLMRYGYI